MNALNYNTRFARQARVAWDWCRSVPSLPQNLEERREIFREKLVAWWNGEVIDANPVLPDEFEDDVAPGEPEAPFSSRRLRAIEHIWGPGFLEPGGERFARKLLNVLAVTSKHTVLDLTAGLGGTARALSSQRSLWMDAWEPIPELAAEGQLRSAAAGMGKRVAITPVDFDTLELKSNRYHVIFSRERLCGISNKEHVLDACVKGLKNDGQILLTDFVARDPAAAAKWRERGEIAPHMWSLERYRNEIEDRGLVIQIAQDMTDEYLDLVHSTWAKVPKLLTNESFSPRNAALIVEECELWQQRSEALISGGVAFVRLHAIAVDS